MKALIILIVTIFTSFAFAKKPFNLCSFPGFCSPAQEAIFNKFQACNKFDSRVLVSDFVVSGSCYHVGRGNDSYNEQFGVSYFDLRDGDLRFGGRYAFFTGENPFKDMTVAEAQESFAGKLEQKSHTVTQYDPAYGYLIYPNEEADREIEYWFKTCDDRLLLLAHWGYQHRLVCEMTKNNQ